MNKKSIVIDREYGSGGREVDGVEASRIEAYIKRRDNQRKNYNKFFTDKTWGDRNNYDLMLNTSTLGYEGAAAAILALMGE